MVLNRQASLVGQARKSNKTLFLKLIVIAAAMFGFGYALVPFYRLVCEVTGINILTRVDALGKQEEITIGKEDKTRPIQIELPNYQSELVEIKPKQTHFSVNVGALNTVVYQITNRSGRDLVGQALPSFSPSFGDQFFKKLECFCFRQQRFAANEIREFPVIFAIAHELPTDVKTITLSYRFFEVGTGQAISLPPSHASQSQKFALTNLRTEPSLAHITIFSNSLLPSSLL